MRKSSLLLFAISVAHLGTATHVRADEIRISKWTLEGRLIEQTNDFVRIETVSGILAVPASAITRRIPGPSRLELYAEMRDAEPLTPTRHLELVAWCRSVALYALARQHAETALAAEPWNPDALMAVGYVELGDVWLKAEIPTVSPLPPADAHVLIDKLVTGWQPHIRAIKDGLSDADVQTAAKAKRRLMSLREPLSIPAACRLLGEGDDPARMALAEMLGTCGLDAAALNLMVMALLDPSPEVRRTANAQLAKRGDPRIVAMGRRALRCKIETLLKRASTLLGQLGDSSAAEDLITILPVSGSLGVTIRAEALFDEIKASLAQPISVPIYEEPFEYPATIAFASFRRDLSAVAAQDQPPAGSFRSCVQDALIELTGENFGFDLAAWQDWASRRPSGHPPPEGRNPP